MQIITFFTTKGGAGRTMSTMALASGFLAQGKRVMVMDCTGQAKSAALGGKFFYLPKWRQAMSACGIHGDRLELNHCWTPDGVENALKRADERGFDIALIDTRRLPQQPQYEALRRADLILSPAIGPVEAQHAANGTYEYLVNPSNVLGMIPGCSNGADLAPAIRAAFNDIPVLRTELPWSEAISNQIFHGDIGHFVSMLRCRPDQPGFGRYKEAEAAWCAVLAMTVEIEWALQGLRLEHHVPHSDLYENVKRMSA